MEHFISNWGYLAIFVLTVGEACCVPIPSEITLGLGGALSSGVLPSGGVDHHPLNLVAVILIGVAGEVAGSSIAYVIGRTGGRALVDRFGKFVLLSHADLDKAEAWFARRGESTVMLARVVPVVRAFISFPAGVAEMDPVRFIGFTVIGVAVWVSALAGIGYALGSSWHSMVHSFNYATYVLVALILLGLAAGFRHRLRLVRARAAEQAAD